MKQTSVTRNAPRLAWLARHRFLPALLGLITAMGIARLPAEDVRQGLISYWPLDAITPTIGVQDVVSTNDMFLIAMDASNLVPGRYGNALSFDGTNTYAYYQNYDLVNNDTGLPISRSPVFSVLLWVKAQNSSSANNDRRAFAEGSSAAVNPMLGVGTQQFGTNGATRIYFRDNGGTVRVDRTSTNRVAPFDNAWHHIAWVANNGVATLYIDGVLDSTNAYTPGAMPVDITTLGCLLRTTTASFYKGLVDDVAVWDRALSQDEVQQVLSNSIALPVPPLPPAVTVQPAGSTNLWPGDAWTFSGRAGGIRPLTYQWYQNGAPLTDATNATLVLANLTTANSGGYSFVAANPAGSVTSLVAQLTVNAYPVPNLTNGMLAYWPLDAVDGGKTPDLVNGLDLNLDNIYATNVVPGRWGNAFSFVANNQTLAWRKDAVGEPLPVYGRPEFAVSVWVNGPADQNDLRVFAEGNTSVGNTLFTLGSRPLTAPANSQSSLNLYLRTDGGTIRGPYVSTAPVFDGANWHHVVYVQRLVGGTPRGFVYIDGQLDAMQSATILPPSPITANTLAIGGLLRASKSHWINAVLDDVAAWSRALTPEEITQLYTTGTPTPPANIPAITINSFTADTPAVARGGSVVLRWDASRYATVLKLDQGIGSVYTNSVSGAGTLTLTNVQQTRTYTLTASRGTDVVTARVAVGVVDGVTAGWQLVDNFDRYAPGALASSGWWSDLVGTGLTNSVVTNANGNRLLELTASGVPAALFRLNSLAVKETQQRTLFLRFVTGNILDETGNTVVTNVGNVVGLTDKPIRNYSPDADSNCGPEAYLSTSPGLFQIGAQNGIGAVTEFAPFNLQNNTVYNLWLDVQNQPLTNAQPLDVYSLYIAKDGESTRTTLFADYLSNRDPLGTPDLGVAAPTLDKLFVAGATTPGAVRFDDFYLSTSGYNPTVPRAYGYTGALPGPLHIKWSGSQLQITWDTGILQEADSITGDWSDVPGAAAPSYLVTPVGAQKYYRTRL